MNTTLNTLKHWIDDRYGNSRRNNVNYDRICMSGDRDARNGEKKGFNIENFFLIT